jgi:large subunit ribosomal protein L15
MVVNKRKKHSRMRGHYNHGWGGKKKRRGAGNRGGKGMAGSGKRADQKKPSLWKEKYFGKHGFSPRTVKAIKTVNINFLDQNADKFVKLKLATSQDGKYVINLKKLGFDKLLGKGKVTKKLDITADTASKQAIESVKSAGGSVLQTIKEVKRAPAKNPAKQAVKN